MSEASAKAWARDTWMERGADTEGVSELLHEDGLPTERELTNEFVRLNPGDKMTEQYRDSLRQRAVDMMPPSTVIGRDFAIALIDRYVEEPNGDSNSGDIATALDWVGRTKEAEKVLSEYARYISLRMASGECTDLEYEHYQKISGLGGLD